MNDTSQLDMMTDADLRAYLVRRGWNLHEIPPEDRPPGSNVWVDMCIRFEAESRLFDRNAVRRLLRVALAEIGGLRSLVYHRVDVEPPQDQLTDHAR